MRALGITVAWGAWRDYDPSRGVPLSAFIYLRVMAGALTRYRQEWCYASHCLNQTDGEEHERMSTMGYSSYPHAVRELLHCALARLPDSGQRLVEQLFWQGDTETEVARHLGISHQAVSKRKRVLLRDLRECFDVNKKNKFGVVAKSGGRRSF
jgi:DNA-directed RNA polymerase specialized sigma24 family protein